MAAFIALLMLCGTTATVYPNLVLGNPNPNLDRKAFITQTDALGCIAHEPESSQSHKPDHAIPIPLNPQNVVNYTGKIGSHPRPSEAQRGQHKARSRSLRRQQLTAARRQLQAINKPAVKSIQSFDGDIIDCVEIGKQAALDHPLLKNHKIKPFPSSMPSAMAGPFLHEKYTRSWQRVIRRPLPTLPQLWHQNGSCPLGTIPVRRTSLRDLLRDTHGQSHQGDTKSALYGRKSHKPARLRRVQSDPLGDVQSDQLDAGTGISHEHAIAFVEESRLYGARAVLSVWEPWVEASNEFSLSQLWILGGSFDGDLNSIEAGWQVSPELYGDTKPRLFIYWTSDGYQGTGCYNLLCSGFVQTSNSIAIGASIAPVSSFGGRQYEIDIMVWKDPKQGNWWMAFEGSQIVGYWPSTLFTHLSDHAEMVEWGGEVVNSSPNGHHTGTQMGSGKFSESGFGWASFFHSLQIVDSGNNLQSASNVQTLAEHPQCYDIRGLEDPKWGTSFYYGGPGRNALCT